MIFSRQSLYKTKIKMQRHFDKFFGPIRRLFLKERDFTIISNNCWDWKVYFRYQLPYKTPTANLLFPPKDYIRLISDLPHYMNEELVEIDLESFHNHDLMVERCKKGDFGNNDIRKFIYCRLGDVDFVCWHYSSFEDVKSKWERRKTRINYDKLLFKMNDSFECNFDDFKNFLDVTKDKKAIFLTGNKKWKEYASSNPNVYFVKKMEKYGRVIDDVHHNVLPFNLTRYLNKLWKDK